MFITSGPDSTDCTVTEAMRKLRQNYVFIRNGNMLASTKVLACMCIEMISLP